MTRVIGRPAYPGTREPALHHGIRAAGAGLRAAVRRGKTEPATRINPQRVAKLDAMDGLLPAFYFLIVLKVPVLGMIWLLWWADRANSAPSPDDAGSSKVRPSRPPHRPFGPRRGPHGGGILAKPEPAQARRPRHADGVRERARRARERSLSFESNRK